MIIVCMFVCAYKSVCDCMLMKWECIIILSGYNPFICIIYIDLNICSFCATTIDNLATYMFLHVGKDKPIPNMIRNHLASEPSLLPMLMSTLMNQLLFAAHANHWAVTRPVLSLMLASEQTFTDYENNLIGSQPNAENQTKLKEEFVKLTSDIQRSVDTVNRDRFTQKLTLFRLSVRQFLTL